jgi:hypothetical protein
MLGQRATRGSAHMSGALHGADGDDSKGFGPDRARLPSVLALRGVLAVTALVGAVLLLLATFSTVIQITVGTATRVLNADTTQSGWDRHGPALALLALLALWLLAAALRGSRVAMVGLPLVGVVALAIPTLADRPHVHDTGSVGDVYAEATADPGTGYYLETLGGALLLFSGGALLALGRTPIAEPARARRENDDGRPGGRPSSEAQI